MRVLIVVCVLATAGPPAWAGTHDASTPPEVTLVPPAQEQAAGDDRDAPEPADPDLAFVPAEPDFTLIALPSTLRLPSGKWAFRVTHRFTRALGDGDFGDLASDLFGLDGGALVGLEVRYGVRPGTQLALLRTSDRSIQLLAQHSVLTEREGRPAGLDLVIAVQGLDNFSEDFTSTIGLLLSRRFGDRGAVYAEPLLLFNAVPAADDDEVSVLMAVGTRIRFGASTYLVAEIAPRVSGPSPGDHHASLALEKRRGGHSFQLTVSNSFATTLAQLANGFGSTGDWRLGFGISRKFWRGR